MKRILIALSLAMVMLLSMVPVMAAEKMDVTVGVTIIHNPQDHSNYDKEWFTIRNVTEEVAKDKAKLTEVIKKAFADKYNDKFKEDYTQKLEVFELRYDEEIDKGEPLKAGQIEKIKNNLNLGNGGYKLPAGVTEDFYVSADLEAWLEKNPPAKASEADPNCVARKTVVEFFAAHPEYKPGADGKGGYTYPAGVNGDFYVLDSINDFITANPAAAHTKDEKQCTTVAEVTEIMNALPAEDGKGGWELPAEVQGKEGEWFVKKTFWTDFLAKGNAPAAYATYYPAPFTLKDLLDSGKLDAYLDTAGTMRYGTNPNDAGVYIATTLTPAQEAEHYATMLFKSNLENGVYTPITASTPSTLIAVGPGGELINNDFEDPSVNYWINPDAEKLLSTDPAKQGAAPTAIDAKYFTQDKDDADLMCNLVNVPGADPVVIPAEHFTTEDGCTVAPADAVEIPVKFFSAKPATDAWKSEKKEVVKGQYPYGEYTFIANCVPEIPAPGEPCDDCACKEIKVWVRDVHNGGELVVAKTYAVNPRIAPDYQAIVDHFFENFFPWGTHQPLKNYLNVYSILNPLNLLDCEIIIDAIPAWENIQIIHELYTCCRTPDGTPKRELVKSFIEDNTHWPDGIMQIPFLEFHTGLMVNQDKAEEYALTRLEKMNAKDYVFRDATFYDGIKASKYIKGVVNMDGSITKIVNDMPTIILRYDAAECVDSEQKVEDARVQAGAQTTTSAPVQQQLPATGAKDITAFFMSAVALLGLGIFFAKKR